MAELPTIPGETLPGEARPAALKKRNRFMRGIQRISSSPALVQLGRSRSASNPYSTRASLSCASLATSSSSQGSSGAVASGSAPSVSSGGSSPSSPIGSSSSGSNNNNNNNNNDDGNGSSTPRTPATEQHSLPVYDGIESRLAIRRVDKKAAAGTVPLPADIKAHHYARSQTRAADDVPPPPFHFWGGMPHEIKIHILSYLRPKELVRVSRVSWEFHASCFDGQLWTSFDASEFYESIPARSLSKILATAGPFVRDLNLRGCVQIELHRQADVLFGACNNLTTASLEGCRNVRPNTLYGLIAKNARLRHVNLTGLIAATNTICFAVATACRDLESLNVSWCTHLDAAGLCRIVRSCKRLRDLRAGEVRGFGELDVARAIFEANTLERLVLSGCTELTDEALGTMLHGTDPEIDILTEVPVVPPRRLRHLDLTRCSRLTSEGVAALAHLVPDLEALLLSGCPALNDAALIPVLASAPLLTHLDLEDLGGLTNALFSEHLAKAPCAPRLRHLSVGHCEELGDSGLLPVVRSCTGLASLCLDNTRVSNFVLAEAVSMVQRRSARTADPAANPPRAALHVVVYDCQNVTTTGIREVLYRNALVKHPRPAGGPATYPTEIVSLKCFYGHQPTVDEHTKRVLRGQFAAASRLERKWGDYIQATEEATVGGAGGRRRRRRAREAALLHADEEGEIGMGGIGRRRARTIASCVVM